MNDQNNEMRTPEKATEQVLRALQKEYVVVGKTHVRAWHAWLTIGLIAGIVAGVALVANRSGKFEPSSAAGAVPPVTFAKLSIPNSAIVGTGRQAIYRFSATSNSDASVLIDILSFSAASENIEIDNVVLGAYGDSSFSASPLWSHQFASRITQGRTVFGLGTRERPVATIRAGQTVYFELAANLYPDRGSRARLEVSILGASIAAQYPVGIEGQVLTTWTETPPDPDGKAVIRVLSPNGGEQWPIGSQQHIRWSATGSTTATVDLSYVIDSPNAEAVPVSIGTVPNTGSFLWTIPNIGIGPYRIRASIYGASPDLSDAPFRIVAGTSLKPVIRSFRASPTNVASGGQVLFSINVENAANLEFTTKCQDGLTSQSPRDDFFVCNGRPTSLVPDTKEVTITFVNSAKSSRRATITATAYDAAGNKAQQRSVTVLVRQAAPVVTPLPPTCISCAAPPAGCSYTGGTCESCGTVSCPTSIPVEVGTLRVSLDASSPGRRLVTAGTTDNVLAVLRFLGTYESILLQSLGLELNGPVAAVQKITVWDGATKVGEVVPTNVSQLTALITAAVRIPKDGDKMLIIKADIAEVGTAQPARAGDAIAVSYDGDRSNETNGVGETSALRITSNTQTDVVAASVRVFRAIPTVAVLPLPSSSLADASQKSLYRFSVSAPANTNGVSLYKTTFNIAMAGDDGPNDFSVTNLRLFAFRNANFSGGAYSSEGQLNNGPLFTSSTPAEAETYFNPTSPAGASREAIFIPAGEPRYFELRGDIVGADSGDLLIVSLLGDAAQVSVASAETVDSAADDDFIWSGNSATALSGTGGPANADWINGYLVSGLPSSAAPAANLSL